MNYKTNIILALNQCQSGNSQKNNKDFWLSFINLQKSLPSDINIKFIIIKLNEIDDRDEFVFKPIWKTKESLNAIKKNANKTTNNFSTLSDFINLENKILNNLYQSLRESKVITSIANYIELNNYNFEQLILLNWNLLIRDQWNNEFIYDNALPLDKIYFKYKDNIDVCFSSDLIIIPKQYLNKFSNFERFFYSSIKNKNKFIELFNNRSFMFSYSRNPLNIILDGLISCFKKSLKKILYAFEKYKIFKFIFIYKYDFIISKLKIFANSQEISYENSFVDKRIRKRYYSLKDNQIVNPILKYFIYKKKLREHTRFIENNDFQNDKDEYIINQKEFILILNKENLNNEIEIRNLIKSSKFKPSFILCILRNKLILFKYNIKSNRLVAKYFHKDANDIINIENLISDIRGKNLYAIPFIVLPSIKRYLSCNDLSYLNALLQFFIWHDYDYISLINRNSKFKDHNFPDLYYSLSTEEIKLSNCLVSYGFLKKFINNSKLNLKFINKEKDKILFISKNKKLF